MPELSKKDKLRLLTIMLESRHADLREQNLNRQGKGHFHTPGMGHEALAAISIDMEPDDYIVPFYRDRGLVLGRGMTTRQLGLEYFAKRKTGSGGRMMASHYSDIDLHIWSVPTPTGSQLLPACGIAWGLKLDGKKNIVVTTVGDAATRQGDFFEAVCFAKERELPVLFIVEDNAYGISTPTRKINPLALGVLERDEWQQLAGENVQQIYDSAAAAIAKMRAGGGPHFWWVKMERLSSHTSSDDQKLYRSAEELAEIEKRDPVKCWKEKLIVEGLLTADEFAKIDNEIKERVRSEFAEAEKAEDPSPNELTANVTGAMPKIDKEVLPPGKYRIGDTVNQTLRLGLKEDSRRVIFGEDVEDPKGGVFRLTQKLSTEFPKQVFNSPLAESTILGVACGLAAYGRRPVFELQFIDFIYPGFNQLVTNISNLRWRTFGNWKCPAVIYAPYGAYLPGGSLWHSQANESALAHYPGLTVVIPSTPEDAAGLLWTAMHAEDPVLFLIPKHMFWAERESKEPVRAVPFGQARKFRDGSDVTLVAWGNTVEKSLEALAKIDNQVGVELFDLRSIVPWDKEAIAASVHKTGRLVVVQEDTENCSVGQMIITHITSQPDLWSEMVSPPILVSKTNVMIGYNPIYEYAALPDVDRIVAAIRKSVSTRQERKDVVAAFVSNAEPSKQAPAAASASPTSGNGNVQPITVPIMGEGIRNAKIVSLLKKPGDPVALDDDLCEVETDKAVYPIQSSFAGTMGEWKTKVGDTVEIGQELGTILTSEDVAASVSHAESSKQALAAASASTTRAASSEVHTHRIEPALSPTITRKLSRVIPANLQIDARWDAIHKTRDTAKKKNGKNAPSPSVMIAWAVVRAMEKHAPFRRLILEDESIVENENFDLGVAVALEHDRLATAVIVDANKKSWPEFVKIYDETIEATRGGRVDAMNAPVVITSLGAFGVKAGAPIVVPPSVGTLFVGTAHHEIIPNGKKNETAEVITLSLTFDHRVLNGAAAASFVHEIKQLIEKFTIPTGETRAVASH
ncbi:MAG TPA: thiamine pyrophosphate-dependent enzyme [Chthoniobacterales bacterium]|jgi:2-oxoisovalerate dehydrogenase E1 component|nr:thiamine pyrophosphate-dependent enzyme [Chthoniobacterales bacterium]